ncbi:hypothetical protein OTK49_02420 [Vibrio coralliirubri]|uniref:hypothetical protein n=1 Tax=Vibrio coralliirubri TaxID=1516159 RepID=UPI002283FB22|nr:hypothetical protein [Vibrio coralliirubri]MCY9861371.1 hypothetical protein [Vibrio coralliirubri]
MANNPDIKLCSSIYATAIEGSENLPDELHFEELGVTLKKGCNHDHCRSGSHRTISFYGGYGSFCYQEFAFGDFSFTISKNSDFPTPNLEFVLKRSDQPKRSITINLTEHYLQSTSMLLEVRKAYHALTFDFDAVVTNSDYDSAIGAMPDTNYKRWAAEQIMDVRKRLFNFTPDVSGIMRKIDSLEKQVSVLTSELKTLHSAADLADREILEMMREKFELDIS